MRLASPRCFYTLFLCTGNSARSILAEAMLSRLGGETFRAYSAGSQPAGHVHPLARDLLHARGYDVSQLRSKSWGEFALPGAAPLDFVFTLCDDAAGEVCPVWPGQPITAHWRVADPAAAAGSPEQQREAFRRAYIQLERRIALFTELPLEALDRASLQARLDAIGTR
jgi:protein-tyrosine-phosphatase